VGRFSGRPDLHEILRHWEVRVTSLKTLKKVARLETDRGPLCLKAARRRHSPAEMVYPAAAHQHVAHAAGGIVPLLMPTREGDLFVAAEGRCYLLMRWVEGHRPRLHRNGDVAATTRCLAQVHQASRGFTPPPGAAIPIRGRTAAALRRRLALLSQYHRRAHKGRSTFDRDFLAAYPWMKRRGEEAIARLERSPFAGIRAQARRSGCLCHGDPAPRNFVLGADGVYLVDFDSCYPASGHLDIALWLRRVFKKRGWWVPLAATALEAYSEIIPLGSGDLEVILSFLSFPSKAWHTVHRYYNRPEPSRGTHPEKRLRKYLRQSGAMDRFVPEFCRLYGLSGATRGG